MLRYVERGHSAHGHVDNARYNFLAGYLTGTHQATGSHRKLPYYGKTGIVYNITEDKVAF